MICPSISLPTASFLLSQIFNTASSPCYQVTQWWIQGWQLHGIGISAGHNRFLIHVFYHCSFVQCQRSPLGYLCNMFPGTALHTHRPLQWFSPLPIATLLYPHPPVYLGQSFLQAMCTCQSFPTAKRRFLCPPNLWCPPRWPNRRQVLPPSCPTLRLCQNPQWRRGLLLVRHCPHIHCLQQLHLSPPSLWF